MAKAIIGLDIGSYTIEPVNNRIKINGIPNLNILNFLLVVNLTSGGVLYSPASGKTGSYDPVTSYLTLSVDIASISAADILQIFIEYGTQDTKITDGTNTALITPNGELKVYSAPTVPEGKIPILQTYIGDVNGNNTNTDTFIIPVDTVTLTYFECGSEDTSNSSKAVLHYAPDGVINGNSVVLSLAYVGGNNYATQLDFTVDGNGTNAFIVERIRLDAGKKEVYASFRGYR